MFDESLATRVRHHLGVLPTLERKMFGGLCIMVNGNMACGVIGNDLLVRTGAANFESALARNGARPMDFTGRPMRGMVVVAAEVLDDETLAEWLDLGTGFALSLPPR